jgi:hypothetical protein
MAKKAALTFHHTGFICPDLINDQQIHFFQCPAITIPFILIFNDGIEADVRAQASTAVQALFKRQAGLLSRSILLDDYKRAATVSSAVDEVRVKQPTADLRGLKPWQYPKLRRAADGTPALVIDVAFTDRRKGVVS